MKRCIRCGETKALDAFYLDNRYLDSPPRAACKVCINQRQHTPRKPRAAVPKACSTCGILRPPHEFVRDKRRTDGLRSNCRGCFYTQAKYQRDLAYRQANPSKVREFNTRQREARLRYQRKHPEVGQAVRGRRRARKAGNGPNDLTPSQWRAIKLIYGNRCAYCGLELQRLTMDHVVPIREGGAHTASNIVPACKPCNSSKAHRPAPNHQPHLLL